MSPTGPTGPLNGLRVGISGSIPERDAWGGIPDLDQLILRFVSQLAALVFKYGGHVVHGSHPSFTAAIAGQARHILGERGDKRLTLVASELFGDPPAVVARAGRVARVLLTPRIGDGPLEDARTRNDSLTALRLTLAKEADVIVAIGGRLHSATGYNPGVLEELTLARWREVPCFLVATGGGFTDSMDPRMVREFSAGNAMDGETLVTLARTTEEIDEYVGQLLEHLVRHADALRRRRAGMLDSVVPVLKTPFRWFRLMRTGRPAPVVTPEQVRLTSARFAEVREAFEAHDAAKVHTLLRRTAARWPERISIPM